MATQFKFEFETPPPQYNGPRDLPGPHPMVDYLTNYSQVSLHTTAMPAIEEAWAELGLRYDSGLQTIAMKPDGQKHPMTLRSHRLTSGQKRIIDKHLPVCDVYELMATLRDKVTDICFIKKNGTLRRMKCSLKDHIGDRSIGIRKTAANHFTAVCGKRVILKNNLLRVKDLKKNAWRSLYIDSIISVDQCFFIASI